MAEKFSLFSAINRPRSVVWNLIKYTRPKFNDVIYSLREVDSSIYLNNHSINNPNDLIVEIGNRHLEKDNTTLHYFREALEVTLQASMDELDRPYTYSIDMGKLLPRSLEAMFVNLRAEEVFRDGINEAIYGFLWDIQALTKMHEIPVYNYLRPACLSWTPSDIDRLTNDFFARHFAGPKIPRLSIKLGSSNIISLGTLSKALFEGHAAQEGLTLYLFQKALYVMMRIACLDGNKYYRFCLQLGRLSENYLKNKRIRLNNAIDIVEKANCRDTAQFLYDIKALEIPKRKKSNNNKDQMDLPYDTMPLPKLVYPQ